MSDLLPRTPESADGEPLLDTLLREAVPEIKLALGDLMDRENQRAIPDRYVKMLPESTLVVTLRPDAAEAIQPVAGELERELTDSCMRHGSLYDRAYRVRLRAAPNPGAPLFRVTSRRGDEPEPEPFQVPRRQPEPTPAAAEPLAAPAIPAGPSAAAVASAAAENATVIAPRPAPAEATVIHAAAGDGGRGTGEVRVSEPAIDPDATRLDGIEPPHVVSAVGPGDGGSPRFDAERFALVVENEEGEEQERFPIPGALTTVGRETDNPALRGDVAITNAPHVSRRQLALVWAPRGDRLGFTVYNVGLNPLHVGGREVPGANRGKGELDLGELMADHTEWVPPGTEMIIGEHGPVLRIVDTREGEADGEGGGDAQPEVEVDPDATRFG
ncbi:hypothetical protein [Longimicrobium sp.]|uniref:hypothetical protein n=1 Tax=Longimicrobium sp. TaxID=2029185 RepID=UPI002C6AD950|nr:hypothetical protein [Longimicrobium sp.]HSU17060.1 hypothetical protein [Longimicrobium sp.]